MIAKRSTLANALRLAAIQYDRNVNISHGNEELVESFKSQAREVRKLADEIEQADTIRLED